MIPIKTGSLLYRESTQNHPPKQRGRKLLLCDALCRIVALAQGGARAHRERTNCFHAHRVSYFRNSVRRHHSSQQLLYGLRCLHGHPFVFACSHPLATPLCSCTQFLVQSRRSVVRGGAQWRCVCPHERVLQHTCSQCSAMSRRSTLVRHPACKVTQWRGRRKVASQAVLHPKLSIALVAHPGCCIDTENGNCPPSVCVFHKIKAVAVYFVRLPSAAAAKVCSELRAEAFIRRNRWYDQLAMRQCRRRLKKAHGLVDAILQVGPSWIRHSARFKKESVNDITRGWHVLFLYRRFIFARL